jgi:hypothetical protein
MMHISGQICIQTFMMILVYSSQMQISTSSANVIGYCVIALILFNIVLEAISFVVEIGITSFDWLRGILCKDVTVKKILKTNDTNK